MDFLIYICLVLGLIGWIIHLYTLIRSYWSENRWVVRVFFNDYHEAIPEIFIFSGIIILIIITLLSEVK